MTTVELSFPVQPTTLPRDHGYPLYAALSRAVPEIHGAAWLGVHPLPGTPVGQGALALREGARLALRLPAERIPSVLGLAGQALDVLGTDLVLGAPSVSPLVPAASLDARLVVVKLTAAPHRSNPELGRDTLDVSAFAQRYTLELVRQLAKLDITAAPQLRGRQSITVGGRRIVGYSVRVDGLSATQSLVLQAHGLGGKRRMGCGIFRPTRGA